MRTLAARAILAAAGTLVLWTNAAAQYAAREDVVWARFTDETIVLDGVLDESSWANAESIHIGYGEVNPLPTSGWKPEFQSEAVTDPTDAVIKFLVTMDNQLYLAFVCRDSSVVGSKDWARWDGILMCIKEVFSANRPTDPREYFLVYWYPELAAGTTPEVGAPPRFLGYYGNFNDTSRTAEQRAAWDAVTTVQGGQANDGLRDEGYIVEMRVNLDSLGYDVTRPEGDVVQLNFSIWDCDYLYEGVTNKVNSTRTSWQNFWNNNDANVGRVYARPDVTVLSETVPDVAPDVILPNGANDPEPVINGLLDEEVWSKAYTFDIRWGDETVRNTYPGVGPYRSGQWQPEVNAHRAAILDPADATIHLFFRDHHLFLSADVRDLIVQGTEDYERMDALSFIIGHRDSLNIDNVMEFMALSVYFNAGGTAAATDYLPVLVAAGGAEYAVSLKGATTVNTNSDIDEGFTVEMKVDLTHLGYPEDLGDHLLFMGVRLSDGDSFDDPMNDYGTRTWWFRENTGKVAVPWIVMDPDVMVSVEDGPSGQAMHLPEEIRLFGNYPNPFNSSTVLRYALRNQGRVSITVYDMLGKAVLERTVGVKDAGFHDITLDARTLASGVYVYRIHTRDLHTGRISESAAGKMVLIK
jgi:hypothetical protein